MSRIFVPFVALAAVTLTACIAVPIPPIGAQVGREEVATLQPGVSTRVEVHAMLGSPSRSIRERYEIFEVSKEHGKVLFIFLFAAALEPASPDAAKLAGYGRQDLRVLAEYDSAGVLQRLNWEGRVQDSDNPRNYHNLHGEVSAAQQGRGPTPAAFAEPEPTINFLTSRSEPYRFPAFVTISPQGSLVAISYGNFNQLVDLDLRNWQTGYLAAHIDEAPSGCPELVSPMVQTRMADVPPTVFLSDGRHLASAAEDTGVCVWDSDSQRGLLTFERHRRPRGFHGLRAGTQLTSLVSARSAPILATGDFDNLVSVWEGLTGHELLAIEPCQSEPGCDPWATTSVSRLALSDDGELLALVQAGPQEAALRLWNTTTGIELGTMALPVKVTSGFAHLVDLAFPPDGKQLAIHMGDHVEVWSIAGSDHADPLETTFELKQVFILPAVYFSTQPETPVVWSVSIAFSADGRRLVAGDGVAVVWDTEDWHEQWRARLGPSFALTPDGRRIVTGCCVWELPEQDEESTVPAT